jgi:hypothetical protein
MFPSLIRGQGYDVLLHSYSTNPGNLRVDSSKSFGGLKSSTNDRCRITLTRGNGYHLHRCRTSSKHNRNGNHVYRNHHIHFISTKKPAVPHRYQGQHTSILTRKMTIEQTNPSYRRPSTMQIERGKRPIPKNNLSYKNSHNTFPALEDMPNRKRKRKRKSQTLFPLTMHNINGINNNAGRRPPFS